MAGHLRKFDEARVEIDAALHRLPLDSFVDMQAAIAVLFCSAATLVMRLSPELQQHWARYAYEIADNLAAPDRENRHA